MKKENQQNTACLLKSRLNRKSEPVINEGTSKQHEEYPTSTPVLEDTIKRQNPWLNENLDWTLTLA